MIFFGQPWGDVAERGAQIATPLWGTCLHCDEPVAEGDQGTLLPVVSADESGAPVCSVRPQHRECQLLAALGSRAHRQRQCSCYGHVEPPEALSLRDQARLLLAELERESRAG